MPTRTLPRSWGCAALLTSLSALSGCSTLPTRDPNAGKLPPVKVQSEDDAPEISRSAGAEGGVVVLWPRIIPRRDDEETIQLARQVQARLAEVAQGAVPEGQVDVRPEPERVCPQGGCAAISVGAVLTRKDDACAVVALVSPPGESQQRLVPYAADVEIKQEYVPFREPAESQLVLKEYVPCKDLVGKLGEREEAVRAAIQAVVP